MVEGGERPRVLGAVLLAIVCRRELLVFQKRGLPRARALARPLCTPVNASASPPSLAHYLQQKGCRWGAWWPGRVKPPCTPRQQRASVRKSFRRHLCFSPGSRVRLRAAPRRDETEWIKEDSLPQLLPKPTAPSHFTKHTLAGRRAPCPQGLTGEFREKQSCLSPHPATASRTSGLSFPWQGWEMHRAAKSTNKERPVRSPPHSGAELGVLPPLPRLPAGWGSFWAGHPSATDPCGPLPRGSALSVWNIGGLQCGQKGLC